jgi:ribosomal protein S18 acetylase RimI-like enzyme
VVSVIKAAPVDVFAIADTLQQAFFDDPVMQYLFPEERSRRWRSATMFETLMRAHHLPTHTVWTTADHAGAALWSPPGLWAIPPKDLVRNGIPLMHAFGLRVVRAMRALSLMEREHPREPPHWYLAVLGTAPHRQGHGVGSALLAPVLEQCDEEGVPAYLESSKESNISFYARHGFEVTGELRLPGGPTVWPMWREPRPAAA